MAGREEVRRFGLPPKVALPVALELRLVAARPPRKKMREARDLIVQRMPDIECDGEMQGDAALSETSLRQKLCRWTAR
jgi:malate dehydrogenase (oxaloacetate-decarboxylating)(NADP+)